MNSPNLQQRIYLAKALNENTDTLFDHPEMNEARGRNRGVPFSKTEAQLRKENMAAGKAWLAKKGLVKKGVKAPSDKNAEKKQEETNEESITEGVRRMRRLRRAHVSGKASRKTADAYDKELSKLSASRLRRGGARKQTIRAFFTDKPTTPAADKAYERFTKGAIDKANAKGKKIFEDMDLDEGSYVHSKGQLKKAIKGSKREIVKAMKRGNKKEASFWMQNKKDAEEQLKEGSLGQKRVKRVFKSKRDDMKFQDSTIAKTRNLVTRKVLRAGADPRDVATRMKDPSANLRTLNALQRFNDLARIKKSQGLVRTISAKRAKSAQK
jgi:hypothetical protein